MYTRQNFKTKKQFKMAVAAGQQVMLWNPGPFGNPPDNGHCCVEGPHYPEPHRWYAEVEIMDGKVVSVK